MRRVPVGRLAALATLVAGVWVVMHAGGAPRWRTLAPGIEFTTLRGDPYCRAGSAAIGVLRVDPARARLRVRHFSLEPERRPLGIVEWQRRSRAIAVFNAGQYYPDYSYMGLLVAGGKTVSRRLHSDFRAALVAGPEGRGLEARVLDLEREPIDPRRPGWSEVAQSFMLFDQSGADRVRKSDRIANRTAVAQDRDGRLLIATSEGAYTLSDYALLLRRSPFQLTHAMSMDGGLEAELCVSGRGFRWASFGRWPDREMPDAPGAHTPLPAIVEISSP
jgi:hypothetical protein